VLAPPPPANSSTPSSFSNSSPMLGWPWMNWGNFCCVDIGDPRRLA
jgi:hypothetical protein